MKRVRTRLGAALATMALGASALAMTGGTAHALSNPTNPVLSVSGTISSHPFAGAPGNASDIEGLGYVAPDNSMWVADDNADTVWEINPLTGAYKTRLHDGVSGGTDFRSATNASTGETCGNYTDSSVTGDTGANECLSRTDDFESVIYDPTADVLYVTSGGCCTAGLPTGYPMHPTVWKLTRQSGHFVPTSWQALPEGQDPTAAGWRPGTGMYFGKGTKIKTYDFATNTLGSDKSMPVSNIVGIDFTDANTAFITTASVNTSTGRTTADSDSTIHRFDISGSTWTEDTNWKFALKNTGMIDARDLVIIGDLFYVSDGYDYRSGGDHPIYVYTLGSAAAPTAAFTATPSSGTAPLLVQFTDTSTGAPTSWKWDFDNNGSVDSTVQNPTHTFGAAGTYTVKLTATNANGSTSVTHPVTVTKAPTGPSWHYEPLDGPGSTKSTDKVGNGNVLLQYGSTFHSFYQDTTRSALAHSWWDGTRWNRELLDGSGSGYAGHTTNNVGANVTAIVYLGQLQLFYTDGSAHDLRHAWWDGHRWQFESLDGAGGGNGRTTHSVAGGDITVRQFGSQLQVFYSDDSAHSLRHSWWDGTRWNAETTDTGLSNSPYIASTPYGSSFQVVYQGAGGTLRHAWWDAGWHRETLDGSGSTYAGHTNSSVGAYVEILQYNNQLDVVYQNTSNSSLRHSWWNGARWSFETLDGSGGYIPGATSHNVGAHIAPLLYGGGLHLFFQDTSNGALRHAWYSGGWHVEVLDGSGAAYSGASNSSSTGLFTQATLFMGQLQLTYADHGNGDRLEHTWWG